MLLNFISRVTTTAGPQLLLLCAQDAVRRWITVTVDLSAGLQKTAVGRHCSFGTKNDIQDK